MYEYMVRTSASSSSYRYCWLNCLSANSALSLYKSIGKNKYLKKHVIYMYVYVYTVHCTDTSQMTDTHSMSRGSSASRMWLAMSQGKDMEMGNCRCSPFVSSK